MKKKNKKKEETFTTLGETLVELIKSLNDAGIYSPPPKPTEKDILEERKKCIKAEISCLREEIADWEKQLVFIENQLKEDKVWTTPKEE